MPMIPDGALQGPAPVHQPEHIVSLPQGLPDTDPSQPKVQLTQDQVDYLVGLAGDAWPTIKKWWPIIIMILAIAGKAGDMIGKAVNPPADDQTKMVAKVEIKGQMKEPIPLGKDRTDRDAADVKAANDFLQKIDERTAAQMAAFTKRLDAQDKSRQDQDKSVHQILDTVLKMQADMDQMRKAVFGKKTSSVDPIRIGDYLIADRDGKYEVVAIK